jgi:hypothetical protein
MPMESKDEGGVVISLMLVISLLIFCLFAMYKAGDMEIRELKKEIRDRDSINAINKAMLDSFQLEIKTHIKSHNKGRK